MSGGSTPKAHRPGESDELAAVIQNALTTLWHQRRPEVIDDLKRLIALMQEIDRDPDESPTSTEARKLAHQLHGTFGVFGRPELKDRLSAIEQGLAAKDSQIDVLIATAHSVLVALV